MIDTGIACQCGNRFKFGMDLVNGRAPEGLICPTCRAPATAACKAFVDFLFGQEPTPPAAATGGATISDPFGPSPTGKSSGPNLGPMEIPNHTRPPPGTKPAATRPA